MWEEIQSERVHTYLSSVSGTFCVYQSDGWRTHTTCLFEWPADLSLRLRDQRTSPLRLSDQRVSPFAIETSEPLPFAWGTSGSLPSVQNYRPYILSQVPSGNMNILFASRIFCLWLIIGTYIHPVFFFFSVICWSSPRTEISVTQSIGKKIYSSPYSFIFVDVILLSYDRMERAKFIHGTLSLAKLVYYTFSRVTQLVLTSHQLVVRNLTTAKNHQKMSMRLYTK